MNRRSRAARRPRLVVHWRIVAAGATILVALLPLLPFLAAACARDGVPSVSLDGHLAVVNRSSGRVVLATWSPFVFARPARHGHVVTLAENNREVARALPRDVFTHAWRWDFGDHTRPAYGTRVHHIYRTLGTYRIAVLAYYPVYGAWQPFDDVTIHVQ
jgi:hypothetical protein